MKTATKNVKKAAPKTAAKKAPAPKKATPKPALARATGMTA